MERTSRTWRLSIFFPAGMCAQGPVERLRGVGKPRARGRGSCRPSADDREVLGLERERGARALVRRLQRDLEAASWPAATARRRPRGRCAAACSQAADAHGISRREGRRVAGPTGFERVPLRGVLLAYYDVDVEGCFQVVP